MRKYFMLTKLYGLIYMPMKIMLNYNIHPAPVKLKTMNYEQGGKYMNKLKYSLFYIGIIIVTF